MVRRFPAHGIYVIEEEHRKRLHSSSVSALAHRRAPSPLQAYSVGVPVEDVEHGDSPPTCGASTVNDICTASLTATAPGLPPQVGDEALHGLQEPQRNPPEDSVEAWVLDASTISFEFLECGMDGLPALCYDDDYCDAWDHDGGWVHTLNEDLPTSLSRAFPTAAERSARASSSSSSAPPPPPSLPPPTPSSSSLPPSRSLPAGSSPLSSSSSSLRNLNSTSALSATEICDIGENDGAAPVHVKFSPARPFGVMCPAAGTKESALADNLRIKKTTLCKARSKQLPVSLEELTAVYHLPREQAAASLRVGCTFLKKICRTYGIKRWPSRKLAALNNHIDELGLLATKCCPEHDSDMHSNLQLAIRHAEDTRLNIYQNPNCAITRDLYRELHSFRKQCEMQWSAKARSDQYYSYLE